jgi:predicted transcriptional regulator
MLIREVMAKPLPQIPHDAPVERLTQILSHESPAVFVVTSDGKFEILTKYDVMGTIAQLMEQVR